MELFTMLWIDKPVWMWLLFLSVVVILLVVDLFVLHRKPHTITMKESLITTGAYMALACLFGLWVGHEMGSTKWLEFMTGYVVEFSLSMDNVFVMAMIIGYFKIPSKYQHNVLVWGILGAVILRGVMIALGAALVQEFHWVLYIFGAFLLVIGVKMMMHAGHSDKEEMQESTMLRLLNRYLRVTKEQHGPKFWVRLKDNNTGKMALYMTPLMTALVMINLADIVFAVDSVPAIFSITTDTYIVYTSNIFAILGLRSLYFALAAMKERFAYLEYALALVLVFIGLKILIVLIPGVPHISPAVALLVTFGLIGGGIGYSLWKTGHRR